jgi:outer membrane protein OmpA-like peptidoglycan-associated protein
LAGVKKSSASSLLGLAGPLVMGFLGKKIKNEGLNMAGLASLLGSQKSNIMGALPGGLGSLIGFADMGNVSVPKAGGFKWLPWALGILALLALLYFWKGCNKPPVVDQVQNAAEQATETVADAAQNVADATAETVSGLGEFFSKKLACGIEMNIPSNGIEARLAAFIEDAAKPVDKTTWFDFDRLTFETGQATLDMAKSEEQLKNIAEIMKCYPKVKIKVGGYTDNVGNAQANMKLSQGRADNVKAALVAMGVAANRMEAEGYGDQHPVASNDTEEGRAQNRRISCRVMEK